MKWQEASMKRLIRNPETGLFLKRGKWTDDPNQAWNYASISDAMKACNEYQLKNVELLLAFGNPRLDVRLPLC